MQMMLHQLKTSSEMDFHHINDVELFMEQFFAGRTRFRSWIEHIESWWPHRNDDDVLFLRYEEVTADLEVTARRVAAFCGLEIREEEMPRIVERCGIEFMRWHQEK